MKRNKIVRITETLSHDPSRRIILWREYPILYRVALMIMPKSELSALCQFFGADKEALEARFKLI